MNKEEYVLVTDGHKNVKPMSKVDKYGWKISGKPGDFNWINKEDLFVDHTYQRDKINNERISDFAAHWCWVKCGVLTVVIRDDEWWVVDGQHRKLAADKRVDVKKLPCMIYELDGISKEARAFVDINTNKTAIASFDKFRALIVGKDETAIGLNELMKTTGHYYANSSGVKAVRCLMTVWNLYKRDKNLLTDLWPFIADVHQDCEITDSVVKSLSGAEEVARKEGRSLLNNPIRSFLIKCGGEMIAAEIKKEKNITGLGGKRIEVNALIKLINRQKSICKNKLPLIE